MRLSVGTYGTLIKTGKQQGPAEGLSQASHISSSILDGSTRAGKRGFTRCDLIAAQLHWRPARHRDCPRRNITAAMRDLKTKSICDLIALGLMDLDQRRFLGLIDNRPSWS